MNHFERAAKAMQWLIEHQHEQPSLTELAKAMSVSEFHLQRLFSDWVGVSPKRFLQQLTIERLKSGLRHDATEALLNHAFDVGLSGGGRLHDLFVSLEAMTPAEYRDGGANLTLTWDVFTTKFGDMVVAQTTRGICVLAFVDVEQKPETLILERFPQAQLVRSDSEFRDDLTALLDGVMRAEPRRALPVLVKGTNLQIQVWRALLTVPFGEVVSYQALAKQVNRPAAVRAVASCVAANAIAYLIPCHRVIRSSGVLNHYRWRPERKAALIGWERVLSDPSPEIK